MAIHVRTLTQDDLPAADRIFRLAFGTQLGMADPLKFAGDADFVHTRWRADPTAAFGAKADGDLVASNFATNWGSVAFFGPLSVRPDCWNRGLARHLLEPTMELFAAWGVRHSGLFTFAESAKHVGLYEKFGFAPRFLTAVMRRAVAPMASAPGWTLYSAVGDGDRGARLQACRDVTETVYEGLDVRREIEAVRTQGLGDTVLLWDGATVAGLAVCHCGAGSEAGGGACYVKFGAVRSGARAADRFEALLAACEAFAAARGLAHVIAGVSTAREEAYGILRRRGYRTMIQGVAMHARNEPGYHRPGVYVVDDWR